MKVYCVRTGNLETNSYVVDCGGGAAAVIDPGDVAPVMAELEANGLKPEAVLLTHGHFDHILGVAAFKAMGAKVYIHGLDAPMAAGKRNLAWVRGLSVPPFTPDVLLTGGEDVDVGAVTFGVLHTPGHTPGGVCFIGAHELFSGDTLFADSVGRTDLPAGDYATLLNSIRTKLFRLRGDYKVYPGHGRFTTLDRERADNPYVKD